MDLPKTRAFLFPCLPVLEAASEVSASQTPLDWIWNNHAGTTRTFQQWADLTNSFIFYRGAGESGIVRGMVLTIHDPDIVVRKNFSLRIWTDLGTVTNFGYDAINANPPDFDVPFSALLSEKYSPASPNVTNIISTPYVSGISQMSSPGW